MSQATLPPEVLRPFVRETHSADGLKDTFNNKLFAAWLARIITGRWSQSKVLRDTTDLGAYVNEIASGLWSKTSRLKGLTSFDDTRRNDVEALIATVIRNAIRDDVRRHTAKKRDQRVTSSSDDERSAATDPTEHVPSTEDIVAVRSDLERLLAHARNKDIKLEGHLRAAFIAQAFPEKLNREDVERASHADNETVGFLRPADRTMTLVEENLLPPKLQAVMDPDQQRTFAWIARCNEPYVWHWEAWKTTSGKAARTALDTVQKWFRRAVEAIKEAEGEE